MSDRFEQTLTQAFLDDGEARPDLVEAVLARADTSQARRRGVITAASLAGCALTAGLVGASGILGWGALPSVAEAAWAGLSNPYVACALGAALLALAAGRGLLQDV